MAGRPLILASQSPRRVYLMREAGFTFEIRVPAVEEAHDASLTPEALTIENARRKAVAAAVLEPEALTLGADTLVYLDGVPLGKPRDMAEAADMLARLAGRAHEVCTGVYLAWDAGRQGRGLHVITKVVLKPLTAEAIHAYHALVNPLDKAGAYGIQEHGDCIVDHYEGSWTNVMGLPMDEVKAALQGLIL